LTKTMSPIIMLIFSILIDTLLTGQELIILTLGV
jgi:hypothetical protein